MTKSGDDRFYRLSHGVGIRSIGRLKILQVQMNTRFLRGATVYLVSTTQQLGSIWEMVGWHD